MNGLENNLNDETKKKLEELQTVAHVDRYGLGFVTQSGLKGETVASILDHHLDIENDSNVLKSQDKIQ
ncbi:MAG: hypothetical protein GY909_09335 [Oligoflexia bacterium]|nr:hypothetical protein [Oligoflexia bacterium]